MLDVPAPALAYGLTNSLGGTHTSRTIMLEELRLLLAACPATASVDAYRDAVVEGNALRKDTATTRLRTLRGLRELYALNPNVLLFRALRDVWDADSGAQPLLALLCAATRDRLLRASAPVILSTPVGERVTPEILARVVGLAVPDRYNPATLNKIGQNLASSWGQSGHLSGRSRKARAQAAARPVAVAYALLLGYLCGARGEAAFDTLWTQLLDAPAHVLHDQAFAASQRGWLEYRHTGMVTEVGFQHLLRPLAAGPGESEHA